MSRHWRAPRPVAPARADAPPPPTRDEIIDAAVSIAVLAAAVAVLVGLFAAAWGGTH